MEAEIAKQQTLDFLSKSGQTGLDHDVIDRYNGSRRSVKTLSGGEAFKASLISHVGELKQRIDKSIVIKKDKSSGSRMEIVV